MEFDLENPFTEIVDTGDSLCSDVASLFRVQSDHMLSEKYLKSLKHGDSVFILRQETIHLISELCCRFDPFVPYLAVNYLDRFLSSQGMQNPEQWFCRLLAVSCVSLAAKMQKTELSFPCFEAERGFIFDAQTIQRMEMLVLGALKWRMRSITPFSFLPIFIPLFTLDHSESTQAVKARASEIIFKSQNDVKLLEFSPSDIAAAALLSACHELIPFQFSSFRTSIFGCPFVNKDGTWSCYRVMEKVAMEGYHGSMVDVVSSSETPINVLDLHIDSTSESGPTAGTSPGRSAVGSERIQKRRRMGEAAISDRTVQISRF